MIFERSNFFLHTLLGAVKYGLPHVTVVHVTQKYTEATDGHFLVRVSTPNGDTKVELPRKRGYTPFSKKRIDVCIPVATAKSLVTAIDATKNSRLPTEGLMWVGRNTDKESVEFLTQTPDQFMAVNATVDDGRYPKTDGVINDKKLRRKAKARVAFSPKLMAKLCSYLDRVGATAVTLEVRADDQAMVLKAKSGTSDVLMLLMPMKVADEERSKKKESTEESEAAPVDKNTCEKCGQSFANHNGDGSCVEDKDQVDESVETANDDQEADEEESEEIA